VYSNVASWSVKATVVSLLSNTAFHFSLVSKGKMPDRNHAIESDLKKDDASVGEIAQN